MDFVVTGINLKRCIGVPKVDNLPKVSREVSSYRACLLVLKNVPAFVRQ